MCIEFGVGKMVFYGANVSQHKANSISSISLNMLREKCSMSLHTVRIQSDTPNLIHRTPSAKRLQFRISLW